MIQHQRETQLLPIGISDFKKVRDGRYYYIDKTPFIRELLTTSAEVVLIPRPRRFGKTLNMSMLRYFFEKSDEDRRNLFEGLSIHDDPLCDRLGRYPVIFLTFKDVRDDTWNQCEKSLQGVIYEEYARHRYLTESDVLFSEERDYIQHILDKTLEPTDYQRSLKYLSAYLYRHHHEPVILLIDEYDAPIHSGYSYGYYEEVINFLRNFLSGGLKDNEYLFKGVLTGILRVAKESVFSGLNNLGVYTLLDERFSQAFGFTQTETLSILYDFAMQDRSQEVAHWYNGYRFGASVIYNPWSVLNYIDREGRADTYWANTGNPALIESLVSREGRELREELGLLIEQRTISKPIYESIVMRDLDTQDDLLWSLLLFSGYLKHTGEVLPAQLYQLTVPNEEVRIIYKDFVRRWFARKLESHKVERLLRALTSGRIEEFERILADLVVKVVSYHDTGGAEPEKFYHAFVLGLLVWLEGEYQVKSNREAGYGRYDVMLIPNDSHKQGIVMEFKKVDRARKESPEQALTSAMQQIETRCYVTELEAAGVQDILCLAVAFSGKELWIQQAVYRGGLGGEHRYFPDAPGHDTQKSEE